MKRLILIYVLTALALGLWAGAKKPKALKRPAWVDDPAREYREDRFLAAVGNGASREEAEASAKANLAAVYLADPEAGGEALQRYLEITSGSQSKASSEPQTSQPASTHSILNLVSIKTGKAWKDELARHYVIVYLERAETAVIYLRQLADNNALVMGYLKAVLDAGDPWTYHAWLNAAGIIDQVSTLLLAQLGIIAPQARNAYRAPYDSEVLSYQVADAARKLQFRLELKGDDAELLRPALEEIFTSQGFGIDAYAPNLLRCELSLDAVEEEQSQKQVRYQLSAVIMDKESKQIISYADSGREGHISASEARARAVRIATEKLGSRFRQKLVSYIDSLARL